MSYKKILLAAVLALATILFPVSGSFNAPPVGSIGSSHTSLSLSVPFPFKTNTALASSTIQSSLGTTPLNFFSCATGSGDVTTCGIYFLSIFLNAVASLFVSLGGYLVRLGLTFNDHIFDSASVQIGFSVSLALANLGFVLGIIIIAIATILRNETYGVKKALWKLVLVAILINFGLVITRPIVSFAQGLTNYFLQQSVGDYRGQASSVLDYANFVANITNAFAPPSFTSNPPSQDQANANTIGGICHFRILGDISRSPFFIGGTESWNTWCDNITKNLTGLTKQDVFWQMLLSLVFSLVFVSACAFALIVLAVLLFVRYVYLGILLILLPLAWLAWVFPQFSSEFKKWWNNFIKWTFFPPLAVFFIYLAFQTAAIQANVKGAAMTQAILAPTTDPKSGPEGAILTAIGSGPPIQQAGDEVLLLGLMLGGLIAASALAGKAGNIVVSGAKTAVGAIQGYAGRKAIKGAGRVADRARTAGLRHENGETTTALQRLGGALQGVPGLRGVGERVAGFGSPAVIHATSAKEIQARLDQLKALPTDGLITAANKGGAFVDQKSAAAMGQELVNRGLLNDPRIRNSNGYMQAMAQMGNLKEVSKSLDDNQLVDSVNVAGALMSPSQASSLGQELARRNLFDNPRVVAARPQILDSMAREGALKGDILKPLGEDELVAAANSQYWSSSPEQAAEIGQELARRNLLDQPTASGARSRRTTDEFRNMSRRSGKLPDLLNIRPDLTEARQISDPANPGHTRPETDTEKLSRAVRSIKPANIAEINSAILGDSANPATSASDLQVSAALSLGTQHLGKLGAEGNPQQTMAYLNTMRDIATRYTNGTLNLTPEQQANLDQAIRYTHDSIQWQDII